MADRYWVGGSGTWDTSSTTNWSASSGGAGGASVPTSADNVFFDQAGTYTVTIGGNTNCKDLTISAGTVTITNTVNPYNFSTYGNVTLLAGSTFTPYGGVFFYNTTAGTTLTITTNGVSVGGNIVSGCYFRPSNGATVVLGSAFTTTKYFYFGPASGAGGTFDTAGYALTCPDINPTGTNPTITLNNSTVTITTYGLASSTTNFTLNAGTSTVNLTGGIVDPRLCGSSGTYTFYNINLTNTNYNYFLRCYSNLVCNNFTVAGKTGFGVREIALYGSFTVNGTFSFGTPTNYACRSAFVSSTTGTARTLSIATVGTLTAVDFSDITFSGATLTGTSLGDCKGNSNIAFDAAKTVYYCQTGSANWGATGTGSWSATSGGAADATMFPLAQDTAVFPAATYPASGATTTINADYNIGTIDMSLRTSNTMTLATSANSPSVYGNWINGTGTTLSGTGTIIYSGRTTQTITSAGKSFTQSITISSPSSTVQLQDALTTGTTRTTTLTQGTLDLQSYTLSTGLFSSSNSNTRTIAFGTGNITCTGTGTVWTTSVATGLTTTGTQVVNVTSVGSTAITVTPGALSQANSISFNFTGGTYALTIGSSTSNYRSLNFTGFAGSIVAPTSQVVVYGNLTFSTGMTLWTQSASNVVTFSGTSGTQQITTNGKTLDFGLTFNGVGGTFQLQDALTMGSTRTATLTNGTLDLNGKTMTVGTAFTTATGTKNLTFNGGTLVCPTASTTAFNNASPTGFTTTAGTGTGTISMTAATAKTFVGGGSTFNCTLNQGGAGTLTITGSNTFANITNTVQPATVLFTAGTTTTFTSGFSLSGTAGNLITIGSVTAASHTLSKASGTVSSDYLSISRSTATGGASWYAGANSTNGGNNSGWIFTAPPSGYTAGGQFLAFF